MELLLEKNHRIRKNHR